MRGIESDLYALIEMCMLEEERHMVSGEDDLMGSLGYDSVRIMELIFEIEEKYGIEFTDYASLLDRIDRVSDFVQYVSGWIVSEQQSREGGLG